MSPRPVVTVRARPAEPADLPGVLDLAARFLAETRLGWRFDRERAWATLWAALERPDAAMLVVEMRLPALGQPKRSIVGAAIVGWESDWTVDRIGYVMKFYVAPAARGTPAARTLARAMVETLDAAGCRETWATATAAVGADQAFVNLFHKVGFATTAPCLRRIKPESAA